MTLDPVHFDGIAGLADRIDYDAEDRDHREFATDLWNSQFGPLQDDDFETVLEPINGVARKRVTAEEIALEDEPFPTTHGLDAGTLNPRPFKNGIVLDVAHAAMSATPSNLDLHDCRTVVKAVHLNDTSEKFATDWESYNGGSKRRIVHTHLPENQYEQDAVHALALYLAESQHAIDNAERVSDFLLLDGPVYPKGLVRWQSRSPSLENLLDSDDVSQIFENYVRLVEEFAERNIPLAGFVKNVSAKTIVRTLKKRSDIGPIPWAHDAAFFSQVLERREKVGDEYERLTDDLTLTNWFLSKAGADNFFAKRDNPYLDRELDPEQYRVAFCIVYDPRRDLVFKVEAPKVFATDETLRTKIERQVLQEVALQRGPPRAISKADELAAIDRGSANSLIDSFEDSLNTELDENYNAVRWGRDY